MLFRCAGQVAGLVAGGTLQERDLLCVAEFSVRLVLHYAELAVDTGLEQAAQRIGRGAVLVNPLDDRRRVFGTFASFAKCFDFLGAVFALGIDAFQAQGAFHRHLPVAKCRVGEDLGLLGLLESEEGIHNTTDVLFGQLAVLLAQVLAQGLVPLRGVNELHAAFAVLRLPVGEHPDVGGDAGVVEHVERQGHDRLEPVVLDDPAADVALALAGVPRKQRRAVVHFGDATSKRGAVLHLGEHVHQEQQLAVTRAGDERKLLAPVLDDKARILYTVLPAHALQVTFPALPVRRIGEHEVELTAGEGVVGER